ncbi:MAG: trypsin-like peptidase domain-containing protein, partial [Clostridia bacterium]|nr:trypsin-like peptidase domain-containing protein [Clostridia bacterium]
MTNRTLTFDAVVRRLRANTADFAAEPTIAAAAAAAQPATVTVLAGPDEETVSAFSSGVILSREEDGTALILCCTHAVEHFSVLSVCTYDNYKLPATVVGMDWESDVTLLRVNTAGLDLRVAEPTLRTPTLGETVLVLGNPLGSSGVCLSVGFVSMPTCTISVNHIEQTLMKLDCAVNHGNSGGGVFDTEGRLIGMVSAKVSEMDGRPVEGAAFAVPIERVYAAAEAIRRDGYVAGANTLGLSVKESLSESSPIEIASFAYTEREAEAGAPFVPQAGDVIVAFRVGEEAYRYFRVGSTSVSFAQALSMMRGAVAAGEQGDSVTLLVMRGTQVYTLPLPICPAGRYSDL